ncbi:hypothetical protein WA016_07610 [Myxococcus stipitatus]
MQVAQVGTDARHLHNGPQLSSRSRSATDCLSIPACEQRLSRPLDDGSSALVRHNANGAPCCTLNEWRHRHVVEGIEQRGSHKVAALTYQPHPFVPAELGEGFAQHRHLDCAHSPHTPPPTKQGQRAGHQHARLQPSTPTQHAALGLRTSHNVNPDALTFRVAVSRPSRQGAGPTWAGVAPHQPHAPARPRWPRCSTHVTRTFPPGAVARPPGFRRAGSILGVAPSHPWRPHSRRR